MTVLLVPGARYRPPDQPKPPRLVGSGTDTATPNITHTALVAGNIVLSVYQSNGICDSQYGGEAYGAGGTNVRNRMIAYTASGGMVCHYGEVVTGGGTTWVPGDYGESWGTSVHGQFNLGRRVQGTEHLRRGTFGYNTNDPRLLRVTLEEREEWTYLLVYGGSNTTSRPAGAITSFAAPNAQRAYVEYTKVMVGVVLVPPRRNRQVLLIGTSGYNWHFVVAQVRVEFEDR